MKIRLSDNHAAEWLKAHYGKMLFIASLVFYIFHTSSCANTHGAPTGGPKDTIPPVVLATLPDSNAVNVPRSNTTVTLTFDEYIQLKDANKNILLSPPQRKAPKTKMRGKNLVVSFEEELDSNKTYTLYFGGAITDNNEGNVLQNYTYSFSTGDAIDSMLISGVVMDYETLTPVEGVTVALYGNPKDSSVMTTLPDAVSRSDKWGYFVIKNLKNIPFRLYAFKDENNNNLYDQGVEPIAFLDSAVTPKVVMRPYLPQLARLDMKDTAACLAREAEYELYLFKEKNRRQYISSYERVTNKGAYIKFSAPDAAVDSFSIMGLKNNQIIKQFNATGDSLSFWINDPRKMPDTLYLGIKYYKTDTLGKLSPAVENLKLIAPVDKKAKSKEKEGNTVEKKKRSDLLEFSLDASPANIEQTGFVLAFKEPLTELHKDSILLMMSNPRRVVTRENFYTEQDSLDINTLYIKPENAFKIGNDYELTILKGAFKDINGFTNDTTQIKVTLPTDDKLSSITLGMTNVKARYIVELVNDTRKTIFRKYIITDDCTLLFPYLKAGKYSVRITEDKNGNGLLDPGILLEYKQPEMVRLYKLASGSSIIELPEKTDLEQSIDLSILFK